jgi:hypothetical protein
LAEVADAGQALAQALIFTFQGGQPCLIHEPKYSLHVKP